VSTREHDDAVQAAFAALGSDDADRLVTATRILADASAEQQQPVPTASAAAGPMDAPPAGPPKVFWWAAASEQDVQAAMGRLAYFVEWLVEVYDISRRVVPACWPKHPDLVQELWALMCLHHATHGANQHAGPIAFASNLTHARTRLGEIGAGARCLTTHQARGADDTSADQRRSGYGAQAGPFTWTWPVAERDEEPR
jgi:hypothetical protein